MALQAALEYNDQQAVSNAVNIDGFTILGLKAGWRPPTGPTPEGGSDDLGDEDCLLDDGFPAPCRTWYANLHHES